MRPRSYAIRSMSGTREGCPPPLTTGDVDTAMIHMMCVCHRLIARPGSDAVRAVREQPECAILDDVTTCTSVEMMLR